MSPARSRSIDPTHNRLLALVPPDEQAILAGHLEPVELRFKERLYQPNEPLSHAYFPTSGLVSITAVALDGDSVEVGPVGWDGMVGLPLILGAVTDPLDAFTQIPPADSVRIAAAPFIRLHDELPGLRAVLLRYVQWSYIGMAQWILCARRHSAEERMARWLLMCHDRVQADRFPLTHEFLAEMLGARRPTVTLAAGALQHAGLIRYQRGIVDIIDRAGLEEMSCECYQVSVAEYERLFGTSLRVEERPDDPPCDRCGADTQLLLPVRSSDGAETGLPLCPQCLRLLERGLRVLRPAAGSLDPRVMALGIDEARRYVRQGRLVLQAAAASGSMGVSSPGLGKRRPNVPSARQPRTRS